MTSVSPLNQDIEQLKDNEITKQLKSFLIFETFLGVNRLYLCGYRRCVLRISYTYSVILVLLFGCSLIFHEIYTTTQMIYKNITGTEYLLLGFSALLSQKKKLNELFSSLKTFDETLNIHTEQAVLIPKRWCIGAIVAVITCYVTENVFYITFIILNDYNVAYSMYTVYLVVAVHDAEITFFCIMVVIVSRRLRVLKAHIAKLLCSNYESRIKEDKKLLNLLVRKKRVDLSTLHKLYDMLHKSSELLNSIMNLPIVIMIITSGLTTITFLKNSVQMLQYQLTHPGNIIAFQSAIIVVFGRCVKHLLLLIVLCSFANKTKGQVATIRATVYDALNSLQIDKTERRKLKALFHLTRERQFVYALWGVVALDMSLPLSYCSLCLTYFIIVVQFSKFID